MTHLPLLLPLHGEAPAGRASLIGGALATLGVWAASATPLLETCNYPYSDGFEAIPLFYASLSFLPLGLSVLFGAVRGDASGLERARLHLFYAGLLAAFVVCACLFFSFVNFEVA
jgi:hypothetical protein